MPAGLLIGLLFFAAGERALWSNGRTLALVARYTPPGPDGDPLLVAAAVERLPASDADVAPPVLLFGSSQVREGLDCALLEARLPPRRCANLAISAGSPLDVLDLVDQLEARVPRHVTVLGLFPKLMHMSPKDGFVGRTTLRCLSANGGWRQVLGAEGVRLAAGLLEDLSPTLRFKDALAAAWGVARADPRAAWRLELPPQPRRLLEGKAPQSEVYFANRIGVLDADAPRPGPFTAAQEEALRRLLDRGGVTLVIDFPTRPGYETTLPRETLDHYRGVMQDLRARRDVVFVATDELGPLDLADFQDFTHLSDSGRAKVTARVAERLARVLEARAASWR